MWEVFNNTPFRIERGFLRDLDGGERWVVVDIGADGKVVEAAEQTPPLRAAVWNGEPGKSSLKADSDFVLERTGTDVLLHGHAYAPHGRSVTSVEAGFRLGERRKILRAFGVRAWTKTDKNAVVPGPARPLDRVPLSYEEAFGGLDPKAPPSSPTSSAQNPVGRGFCHDVRALPNSPAHRLEHLKDDDRAGPHERAPAGFGPIAPHWAPRVKLTGTYDEAWKNQRAPLWPKDFDPRFFRSAPLDQQWPVFLAAGEVIELFNVTPDGFARVRLPDVSLNMRTVFKDGEERDSFRLNTVTLRPDDKRVELVWHASRRCHGREHRLIRAIVSNEGSRDWQPKRT
jgi:hypothetical protein